MTVLGSSTIFAGQNFEENQKNATATNWSLFFCLSLVVATDVILQPIQSQLPIAVGVFIEGAEIAPNQYVPLSKQIQAMLPNISFWIGIPEMLFDTPNPESLTVAIPRVLQSMQSQGLDTSTPVPLFFLAHSLGGAEIQSYSIDSNNVQNLSDLGFVVVGQILMGSFLNRNQRVANQAYPLPTLTVGGELDGLCHVTRIAESYYTQITLPWWLPNPDPSTLVNYPVVLVQGINHFRFCSGTPPLLVKMRDLRAEIDEDEAHKEIAQIIALFIQVHMNDTSAVAPLTNLVQASFKFFHPIISAFLLEGFYHFKPPCGSDPVTPQCQLGSNWTPFAQQYLGGMFPDQQHQEPVLSNASIAVSDAFHAVYDIFPVHLPQILNNCTSTTKNCELNTTTVSQNVYDTLDSLDTGFGPIAATEIRVKMSSRQKILTHAGFFNVNFTLSDDDNNLCSQVNQNSIDFATSLMNGGAPQTAERFKTWGQPLVVAPDLGPYNVGPEWIWYPLQYSSVSQNNVTVMSIASPSMRTQIDFFISASAGFHYCKLLSPARALEWFYVDGLRLHYGTTDH